MPIHKEASVFDLNKFLIQNITCMMNLWWTMEVASNPMSDKGW